MTSGTSVVKSIIVECSAKISLPSITKSTCLPNSSCISHALSKRWSSPLYSELLRIGFPSSETICVAMIWSGHRTPIVLRFVSKSLGTILEARNRKVYGPGRWRFKILKTAVSIPCDYSWICWRPEQMKVKCRLASTSLIKLIFFSAFLL